MVSRAKCILPNPRTKPLTLSSWTQHQFIGVGSDKTHVNCLQTQSINVTLQCNCEHHLKRMKNEGYYLGTLTDKSGKIWRFFSKAFYPQHQTFKSLLNLPNIFKLCHNVCLRGRPRWNVIASWVSVCSKFVGINQIILIPRSTEKILDLFLNESSFILFQCDFK